MSLFRTSSRSSSVFSWRSETRSKDASEEANLRVLVYDPLAKELMLDTKESLEKIPKKVRVPIRGTETKVPVYMETEQKTKIFIANIDLGALGKDVKRQRKKRKMQYLYVLGQVPIGFGTLVEEPEPEGEE